MVRRCRVCDEDRGRRDDTRKKEHRRTKRQNLFALTRTLLNFKSNLIDTERYIEFVECRLCHHVLDSDVAHPPYSVVVIVSCSVHLDYRLNTVKVLSSFLFVGI